MVHAGVWTVCWIYLSTYATVSRKETSGIQLCVPEWNVLGEMRRSENWTFLLGNCSAQATTDEIQIQCSDVLVVQKRDLPENSRGSSESAYVGRIWVCSMIPHLRLYFGNIWWRRFGLWSRPSVLSWLAVRKRGSLPYFMFVSWGPMLIFNPQAFPNPYHQFTQA